MRNSENKAEKEGGKMKRVISTGKKVSGRKLCASKKGGKALSKNALKRVEKLEVMYVHSWKS